MEYLPLRYDCLHDVEVFREIVSNSSDSVKNLKSAGFFHYFLMTPMPG